MKIILKNNEEIDMTQYEQNEENTVEEIDGI